MRTGGTARKSTSPQPTHPIPRRLALFTARILGEVRAGRRGNQPRHNQPTSARAVSPLYRPASWARQAGRTSFVMPGSWPACPAPTLHCHTDRTARDQPTSVRAGRRGDQPRHNQPTSARAVSPLIGPHPGRDRRGRTSSVMPGSWPACPAPTGSAGRLPAPKRDDGLPQRGTRRYH
jgi:hypothetical protein